MNKRKMVGLITGLLVIGLFMGCDKPSEEKQKPAIPDGIKVEVVTTGIQISWNRIQDTEVSINIYRREGQTGTGEPNPIAEAINSSNSSYLDADGTAGTNYSYAVEAKNSSGTSRSAWSNTVTFPYTERPAVPSGVTAVPQGTSSITVMWNGQLGATGYKVYRDGSNTGTFANCVTGPTPWNGTAYTDEGLQANTDYFYKITSVNTNGESEKSAVASAKIPLPGGGQTNVDWTNYTTDYVFRVRNNSGERLVAFMGNISTGTILGGVDTLAPAHGFKKNTTVLGTQSRDFPVIFVTEAQFNANITNLAALERTPFTRIYGYYNATGSNETVYEVYQGLGGEYTLQVSPSLTRNVELKLSGPFGPTLGFVTAELYDTYFKVDEGTYRIYPVVRQYNVYRNEIISHYPKWPEGVQLAGQARSVTVNIGPENPTRTINIEEVLGGVELSTGSAFLIVENQGTSDVFLFNGNDPQITSKGITYVVPGQTQMFQVNMSPLSGDTYAAKASLNTYKIGSNLNNAGTIGNVNVDVDTIYRIVVNGNDGGFTATQPVFEAMMEF
jgi:hypothetical protein